MSDIYAAPAAPPSATPLPAFPAEAFDRLLPWAFSEDEGHGDVTSLATIAEGTVGRARLLCKQAGVIAGLPLVERVFRHRGYHPTLNLLCREGEAVAPGRALMDIQGPMRALLVCERILLNFLQRLSGIASVSREYADALGSSTTRLLDTRKTMPGYRALDKYAVATGGGTNHRMGLYDMVLVKDNHAEACGSVRAAVDKVHADYAGKYTVEAEVRTLAELETLLDAPVDIVLLDNMDDGTLKEAVAMARSRAPRLKLEASGNMDLERVRRIRDFGLDYVSVGALTHSVRALDISLDIVGEASK
ncbi:MAG TPA: carboxylating nicotinate-nucleotide diphosphorylase [Fibrobacteria bacterium]|nr:carboxylating nicotinate-nucleotide diphosphorylase [Fibrobacteria bacterium]